MGSRTPLPIRVAAALLLMLSTAAVHAQVPASTPAGDRLRPVATAVERSGPVRLDGRLDETAWTAAPPATEFTQQRPNEGAPAANRTEVRFLFDDEALYIGARMYDSLGAAGVTSRLVRRDAGNDSDILRIDFDTYRDRRNSVEFDVNPSGWRGDATGYDRSWDPVWEVATEIDSLGWTAEIRIPFSQLRFSRDTAQVWGLNITRITHRTQERALWSFWRQTDAGGPAFFGDLQGLRIRTRPQRAELLPYVVSQVERLGTADRESPFYKRTPTALRVGGDLKYLLTNSFTLSATVNPDFGQVEVDPAVVNLTAFESFFPERRPFFVEGSDLFRFGSPGCNINCSFGLFPFYSRRIGRAPQGASLAYAAGDFADVPENTTILGAVKLTGRTQDGYSVGAVNAVTREESALIAASDGARLEQPVEPLTNSFVARARREMRGGNLVVGGMLTSVDRRLGDAALASLLPRSARTVGADVDLSWGERAYNAYVAASVSDVRGEAPAILRLQRSSARYFQRPDRTSSPDGLFNDAYDPAATVLTGAGAIARVQKQAGTWTWDVNAASVSPGYETNDLGFQQRAGWRWLNGTFGRQYTVPTRIYRNFGWMAGAGHYWNFDGDRTEGTATVFVSGTLANYWSGHLGAQKDFSAMDDRRTRGGPVVAVPGGQGFFGGISTDPRRRTVFGANSTIIGDDEGGYYRSLSISATLRPRSNVSFSFGPGYSAARTSDQYVTAISDPEATTFAGRRYVFAWLDQRQLHMNTRASVTFTPSLSLELFAQPLIASGNYYDFQEYAAPRTVQKLVYGRDVGTIETLTTASGVEYRIDPDATGPAAAFTVGNPDFNFRSLRGTSVLRWEWRPGSTAYLVWTQTRSGVAPFGDLDFGRDRRELFRTPADNVFLVKVSYWLGF